MRSKRCGAASDFVRDWIQLLRLPQWVKNSVVLAPLVFSQRVLDPVAEQRALLALVAFCLASSAAYVLNDIADRSRDRLHPLKRDRPLAAGRLRPRHAAVVAALLLCGSLGLAGSLSVELLTVTFSYLVLQGFYSIVLKNVLIADVVAIATGFVLRAAAGVVAVGAHMSGWLLGCTFLLALFMGFGKRRHEALLIGGDASGHREVLGRYTVRQLDVLIGCTAASTTVFYTAYAWSPAVAAKLGTQRLYLTIPFVVFGLFRYLFLVYRRNEGGSPTDVLLGDGPLQLAIASWLAVVFVLLYR